MEVVDEQAVNMKMLAGRPVNPLAGAYTRTDFSST
jgi:hypothetical protein